MTEPTTRRRRRAPGLLFALPAVGALVWGTSNAAFTATTNDGPNTFTSGTVTLVDDDSGSVMFNSTSMVPGDAVSKCIDVKYTGTSFDLTAVKLYGALPQNVDAFATHLDVKVEMLAGGGASFASCAAFTGGTTLFDGTLAALTTANTNFANGLTAWTPTAATNHANFRFTVTLGTDTPNTAQGDSAQALFTWEVQSA